MKKGISYAISYLVLLLIIGQSLPAQPGQSEPIEKVIGVVGNTPVLLSDLQNQFQIAIQSGVAVDSASACLMYEDLLYQKLLYHKSLLDSLEVSEEQIDGEIERRLRYYLSQFGSQEKMEEWLGSPLDVWQTEMRKPIKEQLLAQLEQSKITDGVTVTPEEIKNYYDALPMDSLPYINASYKIAQIVKKPPISREEKARVRARLEMIRQEVLNGADFGIKAYMYSQDPESSKKNGELGFFTKGSMVPEFESVAFRLKPGEVSEVIETDYGYHILQGIARRGNEVNVRHILLMPQISNLDMLRAKQFLDSIVNLVRKLDTLTFAKAARYYSDDKESANNGGLIVNRYTGDNYFEAGHLGQLDPALAFSINTMKVGEVSDPVVMQTNDGKQAYRIIMLVQKTDAHIANLKDDYQKIQDAALAEKQQKKIAQWVERNISRTYIRVDDTYKNCLFRHKWIQSNK